MGGKSSSKSSANQTTTTNNVDNRIANGSGNALSNISGSTVNIQAVDAQIVNKALDTIAGADATNGEGFSQLLDLAGKIMSGGADLVAGSQETVLAATQAINADNKGTLDQKTIMVLAGAAAVSAIAFAASRK